MTFSGFTNESQGPLLCDLEFAACYGSGASGVVTDPGGDPEDDKGPITAVSLTNGGSGYAKLGRVEPTVTATGGGSGVTITVTLSQEQDGCGLDFWEVTKIEGSGGSGYTDDEAVQFTVADGDTAEQHATARIRTTREEPEVTLEVTTFEGSGAVLDAVFEQLGGTPAVWFIDSVTVTDGGDIYTRDDTISINVKSKTNEVVPAALTIQVMHAEPTVLAGLPDSTGTGASLTAVLSPTTSVIDGSNVWEVVSVTVNTAGSGYSVLDTVEILVTDGSQDSSLASAWVDAVDVNGAILSVGVFGGGEYYKGGPITGVIVSGDAGQYFKDGSGIESIELDDGGVYYREDDSLPPYVADVTVTVSQTLPSDGDGASISATVDDDTQSETFGQITEIVINDGGDDYLAWESVTNDCCGHWLNDKPIVLALSDDSNSPTNAKTIAGQSISGKCLYRHLMCGGWSEPFVWENVNAFNLGWPRPSQIFINVGFDGEGRPAVAEIETPDTGENYAAVCGAFWESDSPIESCDGFAWSATDNLGRSITVAPGGDYDPEFQYAVGSCSPCCQGHDLATEETEVVVADVWQGARPLIIDPATGLPVNLPDQSGTYVLSIADPGTSSTWVGGSAQTIVICHIGFGSGVFQPMIFPFDQPQCQDPPCNGCIKKCAFDAIVGFPFEPVGGGYDFYNDSHLCSPAYGGPGCGDCFICEPTPLCSPSGRVVNIVRVPRLTPAGNIVALAQPAFTLTFQ